MITPETIDLIFSAAQVEEVVGDFVTLKKRGVNFIGHCPFHNEKTPSFTVSPSKNIYKCFGCGKAGNPVNFIMEHEQCSYPEALRYLANKYNIPIEETQQPQEVLEQRSERESMYILMGAAGKYYQQRLHESEEGKAIALSYVKERELKAETINDFQLGWSPSGWDELTKWATENGYTKEYLVKTGLGIEREGGGMIDRFRERVMFPIHNLSGKIVGFGGRTLRTGKKEAKYINSPETDIYNKSKILYGLYQARKAIRQQDECVLVEGYMDVLSLYQAGVQHVAASSGTSLTEDQLRLIKRFTSNVLFLFDGDVAGQKASLRAIDMALEQDMNVHMVSLPAEDDPDTFAKKHDKEELEAYLKKERKSFIGFRLALRTEEEKSDPVKKSGVIKEMLSSLILINDNIKRALYIREMSMALDMGEKLLYDELRRLYAEKYRQQSRKATEEPPASPPAQHQEEQIRTESTVIQEKEMIKTLLLYGPRIYQEEETVARHMLAELEEVEWENEMCYKIYERYYKLLEEGNDSIEPQKLALPEDMAMQVFITDLLAEKYEISSGWKRFLGREIDGPGTHIVEEIDSAMNHFRLRKVMQLLKENQKDLTQARDEEEMTTLLQVQIFLIDIKKKVMSCFGGTIV